MDRIYIAGPMRGLPDNNMRGFVVAARSLAKEWPEAAIFNPAADYYAKGMDFPQDSCMDSIKAALERHPQTSGDRRAIAMLESYGMPDCAMIEIGSALDPGLEVFCQSESGWRKCEHGDPPPATGAVRERIYIAGPMRGIPANNFPAFFAAEKSLKGAFPDADIVNPARLDHAAGFDGSHIATGDFMRRAMRRDLAEITWCTAIAVLQGASESEGAQVELGLARMLGLSEYSQSGPTWLRFPGGEGVPLNLPDRRLASPQDSGPWGRSDSAAERKRRPVASGVLDYFPKAIQALAHCSWVGNEQHNPGEPLHWAREKSNDHADCLMRHFMERGEVDDDGVRHMTKAAWRAMALLELEIESGS
ncbi:MAG: DUF4406 domain-containing protein [Planctomycetota bacterium]